MESERTLRDYARILWAGRWVILLTTIAAGLVALLVSAVKQPTYSASSVVYMGLATTAVTGQVVPSPITTPVTAQKAIKADRYVKEAAATSGVDQERIRDGITVSVERIPGAVGGNLPTVATLRYNDRDRATAIKVVNAYATSVYGFAQTGYTGVEEAYSNLVGSVDSRVKAIQTSLDRERAKGASANQATLISLQQELSSMLLYQGDAAVRLAKTKQQEAPYIVSEATRATASRTPGQVVRSTIFGAILGLILGALATFVWKGTSPERAATAG